MTTLRLHLKALNLSLRVWIGLWTAASVLTLVFLLIYLGGI